MATILQFGAKKVDAPKDDAQPAMPAEELSEAQIAQFRELILADVLYYGAIFVVYDQRVAAVEAVLKFREGQNST